MKKTLVRREILDLWNQARGISFWDWDDDWPRRCDLCGRRIESCDFVSVFAGVMDETVVVHEICYQHGGRHTDCLKGKGTEIDFGKGRRWLVIWASNLLDEMAFWVKSVARFAWLVLTFLLHVVNPVHYYYYRQRMNAQSGE